MGHPRLSPSRATVTSTPSDRTAMAETQAYGPRHRLRSRRGAACPAFVRFVDDFDGGGADHVFLLLGEFNVLRHRQTTTTPATLSARPGFTRAPARRTTTSRSALNPPQAVSLRTSASWAANFDSSLACPNGMCGRCSPTSGIRNRARGSFNRQIVSVPKPPVAAIYVPEVGLHAAAVECAGAPRVGQGRRDGELLGTSLRWFINDVEVNYAAWPHPQPLRQPPAGWLLACPTDRPRTASFADGSAGNVTDSDGDTHSDEVTVLRLGTTMRTASRRPWRRPAA